MGETSMSNLADRYNTTYGNFTRGLSAEIRRQVYGEDIGQNSWTTAEEQIGFAEKSDLRRDSHLLEVGCGSGGPAIFLARTIGLKVPGVDIHEAGISAANAAATAAGLARWAEVREKRRSELIEAEGLDRYEKSLRFSRVVHALSSSRRLSRFMFLARRQ
jgi:2-polyprenyl-3-methyl-5-hydroxy-6-metoxy-1,4-benzoquinol methylase